MPRQRPSAANVAQPAPPLALETAPFLATTTLLMEAVKNGAGRETAHASIKEHALAAAQALSDGSNALPLAKFSALVEKLKQLAALTRHWDNVG